ncbi:MAG: aspartate kinase [Actinomycetia bacterium]|nr:aspartate kinase [Actinomycetes bacterium]
MTSVGNKPIVVLKFGGTSVATEQGRAAICARVTEQQAVGKSPVVVVSAMGRRGDPYATDTLLDLVAPDTLTPEERDLLASCGELISAVVVASQLRGAGICAEALTGAGAGILTDENFNAAHILSVATGPVLARCARDCVPVVCGFQGMAPSGRLTTLGRGGSDTTASALGVALGAEAVAIYTDVDGVMTADPRQVPDARVIDTIRADELFQMAQRGSKVVHTPAAELALSSGVSLLVKNTYSEHPGTRVVDLAAYRPGEVATAVASTSDVARFTVELGDCEGAACHLRAQAEIYRRLARDGISLDMFTPAGERLYFTIRQGDTPAVEAALTELRLGFERQDELCMVTLIGAGMHGVPGVMARIATALEGAGIDIFQVADSHTTIAVLIPEAYEADALRALHAAFELAGATAGRAPSAESSPRISEGAIAETSGDCGLSPDDTIFPAAPTGGFGGGKDQPYA